METAESFRGKSTLCPSEEAAIAARCLIAPDMLCDGASKEELVEYESRVKLRLVPCARAMSGAGMSDSVIVEVLTELLS